MWLHICMAGPMTAYRCDVTSILVVQMVCQPTNFCLLYLLWDNTYFVGENIYHSTYGWPPVWLIWNQQLLLHQNYQQICLFGWKTGGQPYVPLRREHSIKFVNKLGHLGREPCGQSYKASTIVIYDSRVVNYERKLFIRLATGLVVMGRDSCPKGRGFESWHWILDGHFLTYICCKNCDVCFKRPKINEKDAGVGPFF